MMSELAHFGRGCVGLLARCFRRLVDFLDWAGGERGVQDRPHRDVIAVEVPNGLPRSIALVGLGNSNPGPEEIGRPYVPGKDGCPNLATENGRPNLATENGHPNLPPDDGCPNQPPDQGCPIRPPHNHQLNEAEDVP